MRRFEAFSDFLTKRSPVAHKDATGLVLTGSENGWFSRPQIRHRR